MAVRDGRFFAVIANIIKIHQNDHLAFPMFMQYEQHIMDWHQGLAFVHNFFQFTSSNENLAVTLSSWTLRSFHLTLLSLQDASLPLVKLVFLFSRLASAANLLVVVVEMPPLQGQRQVLHTLVLP
jgi:succinate-acetate transporter protein